MLKTHGITQETPRNLMFGAGAYYKNLKYTDNAWEGTVLGATSGGGKFTIAPEYLDAELDGASVKVKGAKNKVGEVGSMEMNLTEFLPNAFKDALHLVEDTTDQATGYTVLKTKDNIDDDDYLENIAFVGALNDGRFCICIMENAFCESAMEVETANKKQCTYKCNYTCHATFEQSRLNYLPIKLYIQNPTTETAQATETEVAEV